MQLILNPFFFNFKSTIIYECKLPFIKFATVKNLFFIIACLFSLLSVSQTREYDHWIEARIKGGFLAAHSSTMGHLPKQHALGVELSYMFQTKGRKDWHRAYNYPIIGLTAFATSAGNRDVIGNYYGVFGFINLPLVKRRIYSLSAKLGVGLAYNPLVYDSETNIFQVAVSTHINARATMGVDNRFSFGNHSIVLGIDVSHFSNSAIKVPNLGLNLPFLSLGYAYRIKEYKDTVIPISKPSKYWQFGAVGIFSVKEVFPVGGKKYPVYGLNFVARRFFNHKTGMELSLDFISKQAIFKFEEDVPKTQAEILQIGAFVGFILPFDHLHLVTGMGIYIKDKYQPEDFLYHRIGMRYVLDNGINFNLVLKSHWGRADYTEFGIGYTFKYE